MSEEKRTIIFFDGICHLCNGFVDFMIRRNSQSPKLYFATLQGETAARLLPSEKRDDLNSVVLLKDGKLLTKSDAVLTVLSILSGWVQALSLLKIIPRGLRDYVYDLVAGSRYSLWGKRESCRIPTPTEREFLLP